MAKEAARTGKPVSEEIHYFTENGREKLTYGYDPSNPDKPYFIERPGPDGKPVRHEYKTINEYHQDFEAKFGHEPGKPVADDFMGAREPLDHEAPTKRPGRLEDEGIGRGTTGDDVKTGTTKPEPGELGGTRSKEPEPNSVADAPQEAKKPGGPSPDDVGKTLTPQDLATRYGMPPENVGKIEAVCKQLGVIVDVRPTTPHAEVMLREKTALPKPEALKAKTINETDLLIGLGKQEHLGKVGFFDPAVTEPHRPPDYDSLPKETQKRIDDRIKQRMEEFNDYRKSMKELEDLGLIRIEPDGTVINTGLTKSGGELPFTGDHDIFDIRAKDGTKLTPEQYQQARTALMAADAGVMHGGVTGWAVDSPGSFNTEAGQKSFGKMVEAHSPGGKEPLVRLGDGEPKAVWHEPAPLPAGDPGPAPGLRESVSAGRPDVVKAFDAADARFDADGGAGLKPSEKFDQSMKSLERTGKMGSASRAEIEGMLDPARRPAGSQRPSRSARDGHGQLPGRARRAASGPAHGRWPGEVRACPRGGARSRAGGA